MKKVILGKTGIEVTELCFGVLPIGPAQKNVPAEEASETIALALKKGITFIDTAQGYRTYPHIRMAMEKTGIRPVIASKSPEASYENMEKAINEAIEALDVPYVDIFLLHAARVGTDIFSEREGALRCLLDYREKGLIKAAGISTHDAEVTSLAAEHKELDIVFPIINKVGLGILNGTREDMERAIENCFANDKAVYLMKALGGGNLVNDYSSAIEYVRELSAGRAPIALGMVNDEEVEMNVAYFNGEDISEMLSGLDMPRKVFFVLSGLCSGCGKCIEMCHSSAVTLTNGKCAIDMEKCLTCGYCVSECPQFAIRMI